MFSTAEPSIEAANAMGALGALQEFRGPCFNGSLFNQHIVCLPLPARQIGERKIPVQIK